MTHEPGKVKILLAEDASAMRRIEIKLLNDLGYTNIVEAVDGDAGIEALGKHPDVNVIISDWNMPNKSGLELLAWVRANGPTKALPFIMATAQSDKQQEHKAVAAGVTCFVAKPFTGEELKAKLEFALSGKKAEEIPAAELGPQKAASGKARMRVAHIQITDHLLLGVLKHQIQTGEVETAHFELETQCMGSWNPVAEALEKGTVDAAFVLAPIAMDLYRFGVPIRLVLFAHRGGSIFVRTRQGDYVEPYREFFRGKNVLIPHKLSIHHMLTHFFFKGIGLKASLDKGADIDVNLEVVAPIKMPEVLQSTPANAGFMVAEPIGTKSIAAGIADLQFLSSELWKYHPCCVVAVRKEYIDTFPDAVQELTRLLIKAGKFVDRNPGQAAELAVAFLDPDKKLGLKVPVLKNVLTEPNGIKTGDLYPSIEDLETIQNYMVNEMGVGARIDLQAFVDRHFADTAYKQQSLVRQPSVFSPNAEAAVKLLKPKTGKGEASDKAQLHKEGKYLTFSLGGQEFGISILKVKEIIGLMDIHALPDAHPFVKGVINLRDRVIPVVDLRQRFAMPAGETTNRSCIIIIENETAMGRALVGVTVDSVSEVANVKGDDIDDAPTFTASVDTSYVLAMAKFGEKVKILLNMDDVLRF